MQSGWLLNIGYFLSKVAKNKIMVEDLVWILQKKLKEAQGIFNITLVVTMAIHLIIKFLLQNMELLGFIRIGRLWNDDWGRRKVDNVIWQGYRESSIVFNVSRESDKTIKRFFGRWWTSFGFFWYYIKLCKEIIWKCLDNYKTVLAVPEHWWKIRGYE